MKKLFLVLASFLFVMIPQVQALTLENVSTINNSDSYLGGSPKIEGNGTNHVTVTFDAAKLKIVAAKPDIGRTIDAAWLGVKVVAPKDLEIAKLKAATYVNDPSTTEKSFWANQDSQKSENPSDEHFIYVYGAITEDILTKATKAKTAIEYSWTFDWDNDSTDDETVTIIVEPEDVTLTAKDNNDILWNEEKYQDLKPDNTLDEGPKTGDELPTLASLMFVSLATGGYAFKKLQEE